MKPILRRFLIPAFAAACSLLLLATPGQARHRVRHHHAHHRSGRASVPAAKSVTVWVNTNSGVYHFPGERWYGNTKEGEYMSEDAAKAAGFRATENGQ